MPLKSDFFLTLQYLPVYRTMLLFHIVEPRNW